MDDIRLNDILRIPVAELPRVKVRLNADYDGEDAVEVYKRDPERVNGRGFLWRAKKRFFKVGETAISFLHVRDDLWLLTTVKRITKDLDVENGVNYEAEEIAAYRPYFNRVLVKWHRTRRQQTQCVWYAKLMDVFLVDSILPDAYSGDEFPGYDRVRLSFGQLEGILRNNRADWVNALRGQKAVYLITDLSNGRHYVGSATSDRGMLLDRWSAYVKTLHGGDVELRRLVEEKGAEHVRRHFQYAILENYNAREEDARILAREAYWKAVLDSRRHGYNGN